MPFDPREIVRIAIEAGQAIMQVYESSESIDVQTKDDDSPLTKADLAAHDAIIKGLASIDPHTPIVSEEGRVGNPMDCSASWLVDPLDGTKEFIKRNGMFTVNIARVKREGGRWKPTFGVVHAPFTQSTPATRIIDSISKNISVNKKPSNPIQLVASGSHRAERDERFAEQIGDHDLVRMGSSLKACVVADGSADLYPRFGPTSCWDIAAAHAVVESSGGFVLGPNCQSLDYDVVEDVLNPYFLVTCSTDWNDIWVQNQN